MIKIFIKYFLLPGGIILLMLGCGNPNAEKPDVKFYKLEKRLAGARVLKMDFSITAEGAVTVDISGNLEMKEGRILLKGSGVFAGKSVDLFLSSDGRQVEYGNRDERKTAASPPDLRNAILTGLTRMGILHNLARLTGNALPDHADGGVKEWVTVDSLTADPQNKNVVSFNLTVAGTPSGSANLEISGAGFPVVRHQTVHFKSGDMRVVEKYSDVKIED